MTDQDMLKDPTFWGVAGTVLGVVLGFALGELSRVFRDWARVRKLKRCLEEELEAISRQIPQIEDILNKAIRALTQEKLLPTKCVHTSSIVYRSHIAEVYADLSAKQRNCLQVVYDTIRIVQEELDSFEERANDDCKNDPSPQTFVNLQSRLQDLKLDCERTKELVQSYLEGAPKDVFSNHG